MVRGAIGMWETPAASNSRDLGSFRTLKKTKKTPSEVCPLKRPKQAFQWVIRENSLLHPIHGSTAKIETGKIFQLLLSIIIGTKPYLTNPSIFVM